MPKNFLGQEKKVKIPYRLLICGDREWTDEKAIEACIDYYRAWPPGLECVIEGEARGADKIAGKIAAAKGVTVIKFPADWDKLGKKAGPVRNQKMLDEGKPNVVVGFHNDLASSRGTKDMLNRAEKAGIENYLAMTLDKQQAPVIDLESPPVEDDGLPW